MSDEDEPAGELASPRTRLMREVANQMEAIDEDYGDSYEIGDLITIVEIRTGDEVQVRVRSTASYLKGLGMLRAAERGIEGGD